MTVAVATVLLLLVAVTWALDAAGRREHDRTMAQIDAERAELRAMWVAMCRNSQRRWN